ncbi:MAG: acyl carrier protein [Acutalibacteraceae bacterium]|nr:phosphopantetheine-binding protein [Oscillospiraceae bacterium]
MEELLKILSEVKPGVDFEKETALIDDGILDSLDIITILSEIFNEFDITVPTNNIVPENFNSAKAIYAMIEELENNQ